MTKSTKPTRNTPAWVTTATLARELNCAPKFIRNTLKDAIFREGRKREYINLNPTAWRPTYRWHLERCLKRYDVAGQDEIG